MTTVRLTHDTIVRFEAGTVLEVSEKEASRLIAFGNAEPVEKKTVKAAAETAAKKTTKKK